MVSVTIRIPARKARGDATVEWYRWEQGARAAVLAQTTIAAADLEAGLAPASVHDFFFKEKGEADRFIADGRALFDAMFSGALAAEWEQLTQLAAGSEQVRVYLAIEDSDLARLPWEMMTDDAGPLFLRPNPILLRWRTATTKIAPVTEPWPIKVLVVVGCNAAQAATIGVDQELRAIRHRLRAVDHSFDLEVLDARFKRCNRAEVRARLDGFNPHVLHFIGHATSDRNGAALKLWDKDAGGGTSENWQTSELGVILQQKKERDLRLVYLNACRTQTAQQSVGGASLAEAFLRVGVPAAIAMQADVQGDAATLCADEFYERIAAGDTIDAAIETGRVRILDRPDLNLRTRNPYCAALTVQREPEAILRFHSWLNDDNQRDAIEQCETLKPVRSLFVNQGPLRRDLLTTFFAAPTGKERSAAVFRGVGDAGKSWLAKWLLAVYAFRNCGVRYVEANRHANWLELMRAVVRERRSGHYVHQPLPQRAQDFFFWSLKHIADGRPVPPGDPPPNVGDDGWSLSDAIKNDNEAVSRIMSAFLETLKIAAGNKSFLLVVDDWHPSGDRAVAAVTVADLKAHLWDRMAEDHLSPVKLLLIMPPLAEGVVASDDGYPSAHWKHLTLGPVPASEAPSLLGELYDLHFNGAKPSSLEENSFQIKTPSLMKELDEWCKAVRKRLGGP